MQQIKIANQIDIRNGLDMEPQLTSIMPHRRNATPAVFILARAFYLLQHIPEQALRRPFDGVD